MNSLNNNGQLFIRDQKTIDMAYDYIISIKPFVTFQS